MFSVRWITPHTTRTVCLTAVHATKEGTVSVTVLQYKPMPKHATLMILPFPGETAPNVVSILAQRLTISLL